MKGEGVAQAPEATTSDELLGIGDVAREFGVNRDTIYRRVRDKSDPLPCFKVFGRLRFRRSEVEAWLERHRFAEIADWKPPW